MLRGTFYFTRILAAGFVGHSPRCFVVGVDSVKPHGGLTGAPGDPPGTPAVPPRLRHRVDQNETYCLSQVNA